MIETSSLVYMLIVLVNDKHPSKSCHQYNVTVFNLVDPVLSFEWDS